MSCTVSPINNSWPVINFLSSDGKSGHCSQSVGTSTLRTKDSLHPFHALCALAVVFLRSTSLREKQAYDLSSKDKRLFYYQKTSGELFLALFLLCYFLKFVLIGKKRYKNIDVSNTYLLLFIVPKTPGIDN